jgi:hypothetical protein
MEWLFSMATPDHTLQTWRKCPFRNRLGDSSTFALLSGPFPIEQSGRNFFQQQLWAPKLAR